MDQCLTAWEVSVQPHDKTSKINLDNNAVLHSNSLLLPAPEFSIEPPKASKRPGNVSNRDSEEWEECFTRREKIIAGVILFRIIIHKRCVWASTDAVH